MNISLNEKMKMVNKIRSSPKTSLLPEECEVYAELVDIQDCYCPTRNGNTHYYLISPKQRQEKAPLVLNIHGGGFCQGHGRRDTIFASMVAYRTGAVVLDLDYKLAPESPFPVALEEGYDLLKWAYEHADELGVDRNKLVTCGHSAGGNLAAAVAMKAAQTKEFAIKLEILDYPPTDLVTDPADKTNVEMTKEVLERLRAFNYLYTDEPENPLASLLLAPTELLTGLPETLIITAQLDVLHDEGEKFAYKLVDAGIKVTIKRYLKSTHGFVIYCIGDEWKEAQDLIVEHIRNIK